MAILCCHVSSAQLATRAEGYRKVCKVTLWSRQKAYCEVHAGCHSGRAAPSTPHWLPSGTSPHGEVSRDLSPPFSIIPSPTPPLCPIFCPITSSSPIRPLLLLLLSHFSRVRLCATPQTAAYEAPPSLGFSRQEHWTSKCSNLRTNSFNLLRC